MSDIAAMLKHQSSTPQLPSHSNGWIELPNGQRWNPGLAYKFNASESVTLKGGAVLRFLSTGAKRLVKFLGGVHAF